MPRTSYREHRASRSRAALAYGSDAELESIASFSTLASTAGRPLSPLYASYPYTPLDSATSSFHAPSGSSSAHDSLGLGPAWNSTGTPAQRAPSISILSSSPVPSPNASPVASSPLPRPSRSPSASGSASGSPRVTPPSLPSPTASSARSAPQAPPVDRRSSAPLVPAVNRLRKESHSREKSNSSAAAEKDEKRRKRERNAERWRRVRAREAAHDAPVRRWAKVAYSRWGARGAMGAALAFALVLRVMLTLVALYISPRVQRTLQMQVRGARSACNLPPLKTFAPLCAATIGTPDTRVTPAAAAFMVAGHLALEGMLGWGAAVAWAVIEGWRDGRTVRTRVAAVVYLVLAPVLVLSDGALLQVRTAPLGLMAWAILAAVSGHDGAAAATMAAASWSERGMRVYAPAFVVYAVGKRIWLGPKGRGYIARLVMSAAMVLTVLVSLQPVPLRARVMDVVASVRACTPGVLFACLKSLLSAVTLRGLVTLIALIPSGYLMIRASYVLRPAPSEPYTSQSVPATARLLPITFTAVAAALALPHGDAALPLLPLSLASSLRADDDEWAVAVQTHHVAVMCLWPAFGSLTPLAASTTLAWDWLIGARTDAPNGVLRAHQQLTRVLFLLATVPWAPIINHLPRLAAVAPSALAYLSTVHRVFTIVSIGMLVVWTNIRLVKSAWAIGAL